MVKLMSVIFYFVSVLAQAQNSQPVACWKTEINYKTNKIYTSEKAYEAHRAYWSAFNKVTPDPFSLSRAFFVYKSEIKKTEKFSKDKVKHCYLGCRISAETDVPTTQYVAWSKEQDDITDCRVRTHFEIKDYEATVDGARHPGPPQVCEKYCLTHW